MSVSKRTRFEVFKRDQFTCLYCGRRPPEVTLQVDHVTPRARGGGDELTNLVTACADCNLGKNAVPLGEVVPAVDVAALQDAARVLTEQAALVMSERAAALHAAAAAKEAHEDAEASVIDLVAEWYEAAVGTTDYFEDESVRRFLLEIPIAQIRDAIEITARATHSRSFWPKRSWKYFCAVCWDRVRESRGEYDEEGDDA